MRTRTKTILWIVGILAFLLTFPQFYWAKPIEGRVVDGDGNSLGGVLVVGLWVLEGGAIDPSPVKRIAVEDVTDDNGEYQLVWKRPRFRPPFTMVRASDPRLFFLREGYMLTMDIRTVAARLSPILISKPRSQLTSMEPFSGSPKEFYRSLFLLSWHLRKLSHQFCDWTDIIGAYQELYSLQTEWRTSWKFVSLAGIQDLIARDSCSARTLFEGGK